MKIYVLLILILVSFGCSKNPEDRGVTVIDDMVYSPAYEAYSENELTPDKRTMMDPVKGTIARGKMPYLYSKSEADAIKAGQELQDPNEETERSLKRGEYLYGAYCSACHGVSGEGDGPVISKKFPAPPSLKSTRVKDFSKGRVFHVITVGFGDMPAHAAQMTIQDRWFLSQYIKKMQK
ncbi:MAG: cytochrome c [Bacteriovoracaceae bacterium]